MPRYPGYFPPFQYYRPYNYRPHTPASVAPTPQPQIQPQNHVPDSAPTPTPTFPHKVDFPVWFDLFGIKLYFDDVLILSLLFFLYKEQVKDEGLFLALLLLLIS